MLLEHLLTSLQEDTLLNSKQDVEGRLATLKKENETLEKLQKQLKKDPLNNKQVAQAIP